MLYLYRYIYTYIELAAMMSAHAGARPSLGIDKGGRGRYVVSLWIYLYIHRIGGDDVGAPRSEAQSRDRQGGKG